MSGIKVGMRVEVLNDRRAGQARIIQGNKGKVMASQGFMPEHFTVAFDNGDTISDIRGADLAETDLGFFRLGSG